MNKEQRPKVGIGVYIRKNGACLFMLRKGSHDEGKWSPPGGHLEYKESFEDCAKRETLEETNISIKNVSLLAVTNDVFEKEGKHYVTVHLVADYESGEAKIMEPEKISALRWVHWEDLPKPLMLSNENFLKLKINPFDKEKF
ncbi:NUDIX domain-containing protein [Candidatus Woesearchaeota archaeon]|nr:NUDIX domain-containing protein [Nanoarchaeota archaeon]MCB9370592.1 NUDIX domain-containing protein [Candidatus Woesearchaeota archaeon]USN43673.1 MAG: NUDIX domain-containing protein [Candidatus Woesearchaeota archaeon]